MQNTDESVDSIYIIEIPVTAVAWCGKGGKKESFSVVQVGKTSNGARGMKNRMGQHNLAWCYASGSKETYSTVNSISEPSKAEHYTVDAIHRFPCIIGAMVVRGDESTSYWERRIRKRIGVTLSETMVTDLLSKPFDSDFGGATVLEKGGKGNFSLTELCLVSKKELTTLRSWFNAEWSDGKTVYVDTYAQFSSRWAQVPGDGYTLRLSCRYSDQNPSSTRSQTRKRVSKQGKHEVCFIVPCSESLKLASTPAASTSSRSTKATTTAVPVKAKQISPAETDTTVKQPKRSTATPKAGKGTQPAATSNVPRPVPAPAQPSRSKSSAKKTNSPAKTVPTGKSARQPARSKTNSKTSEMNDAKQRAVTANTLPPSKSRAKSAPSQPKIIAPAKTPAAPKSLKPALSRKLNMESS